MSSAAAVEARGLIKEFENGRRTVWQRLRRTPDKRTTFWYVALVATTVVMLPAGPVGLRASGAPHAHPRHARPVLTTG